MKKVIEEVVNEALEVVSEQEGVVASQNLEAEITDEQGALEQLAKIAEVAEEHVEDKELVEEIERAHEVVKLNLAYNQAVE